MRTMGAHNLFVICQRESHEQISSSNSYYYSDSCMQVNPTS